MLLKIDEAAKLLTLTEGTLRKWIFDGKIPVVRLGRAVRIRAEVIEQLIQDGMDLRRRESASGMEGGDNE